MASKVLIFTGAPDSRALDWNSPDLLHQFEEPIATFLGIQNAVDRPDPELSIIPASAPTHAAWRSLTLEKERVKTGYTQEYDSSFRFNPAFGPEVINQPDDFLTIASISRSFDESSVVHGDLESQFYEHSLALHQDVRSSYLDANLLRDAESQHSTTSVMTEEDLDTASFLETTAHASRVDEEENVKEPLTFRGGDRLTDLKDIPSAAYLIKAQPQTITCNLIVGIISISQPRTVSTRWGSDRSLVEVLVGDETKAGFAVTFWLPPGCDTVAGSMLEGLRHRDVVLIQNVALNAFTKKVYGSSLRKGLTKVHLLFRARLDAEDAGGHYSPSDLSVTRPTHAQLEKTRRVWDWVLRFVGPGPITAADPEPGKRKSLRKSKKSKYALPSAARPWDLPPPDTQ